MSLYDNHSFPPLPSQPIKSLAERLEEADALRDECSRRKIERIKSDIRGSAEDCEYLSKLAGHKIPTVADIQCLVAAHFGLTVVELVSRRRAKHVVRGRHISIYLAKLLTPRSLPEIGRLFGGLDHTSVLYAARRITDRLEGTNTAKKWSRCRNAAGPDPALAQDIAALKERLLS